MRRHRHEKKYKEHLPYYLRGRGQPCIDPVLCRRRQGRAASRGRCAQHYICAQPGRAAAHGTRQEIAAALLDPKAFAVGTQQLSLDDFTPKVLPDAAPAVQKLAAAGMPARQAAYEVKQEALQCLTRRM